MHLAWSLAGPKCSGSLRSLFFRGPCQDRLLVRQTWRGSQPLGDPSAPFPVCPERSACPVSGAVHPTEALLFGEKEHCL